MQLIFSPKEHFIIKKISHAAKSLGVETYLIGGFVRDKILNRPCKDIDVVCVGDGIVLAQEVAKQFLPEPAVNFFKTYGTAQISISLIKKRGASPDEAAEKESFSIEFVGARKESYHFESRNPQVTQGTLEDDQNRRDFTINALAIDVTEAGFGKMLDPFNGLEDLESGIIKTPLNPDTTFSDDPLRMLRAIRFATQLDFVIEADTLNSIANNAARIKIITQERITDELNKIVLSPQPSIGFNLLMQTGLLNIIFPEMVALAGAEYIDGYGHKDNFSHTLQVLDNVAKKSTNLWLRWAAILHDIAKPATKRFEEGHGWTFHGHEVVGGKMVKKIFAKLRLPLHEPMLLVKKLVELHLRPISLTKENITDSAIRRLIFDAGDDFESLMALCEADITSKNKFKVKRYLENFEMVREKCRYVEENDHIRNWQPPLSGNEIMEMFGLKPSREVGILKDALKDAILDGLIGNTVEDSIKFIVAKGEAMSLKPRNP